MINHVKDLAIKNKAINNPNLRLLLCCYYLNCKGYLTIVDLLGAIASEGRKIENSEFIKKELFDKLFGEHGKTVDKEIVSEIVSKLRGIKDLIDAKYFGIENHLEEPKAPE